MTIGQKTKKLFNGIKCQKNAQKTQIVILKIDKGAEIFENPQKLSE